MTLNWQRHSLSIDLRTVFGKSICLRYCLFNPHIPGIKNLIFSKCQLDAVIFPLEGQMWDNLQKPLSAGKLEVLVLA